MASIEIERPDEDIALVRLNRPERMNALSMEMRLLLSDAFERINADPAVRVVVIAGNARHFAVGADIGELQDTSVIDLVHRDTIRFWRSIRECPRPVIAAVAGLALGGGCELALHADIIVAGEKARFGLPEVRIGIIPGGGGTQRLPRAIGTYRAMRMLMTGEPIDAAQADAWGLVSQVVPEGEVEPCALALARKLAKLPPLALSSLKRAVHSGLDAPLETGLQLEQRAVQVLFASEDMREGVAAFLEKRSPDFKGA